MTDATTSPTRSEDETRQLGDAAEALAEAVERVLTSGDFAGVSDLDLQRVLTATIKLYAAKGEAEGTFPAPVLADKVTPTEAVMVVSEILRAADLNLFDLAMWYRRPR
jgi:hypothetical protein